MSGHHHLHLDEIDLDDDALELAAGGIVLCSSPATCNTSTTTNYTYNQTIYYKITITNNITT